jgi:hypothetical protein
MGKILHYIKKVDLEGKAHRGDLAWLVKEAYRLGHDVGEISSWAMEALEAKISDIEANADFSLKGIKSSLEKFYDSEDEVFAWKLFGDEIVRRQKKEFMAAVSEFKAKAKVCKLSNGYVVASIETFDPSMGKVGRSKIHGVGAEVVIIRRPDTGHVQVLCNKERVNGGQMDDIARILRVEEYRARGDRGPFDRREMEIDGNVSGSDPWYYKEDARWLLNGSESHPDVEPTRLSQERIVELVKIALDPESFEKKCRGTSCNKDCPWKVWQLHKCRGVRKRQGENESQPPLRAAGHAA